MSRDPKVIYPVGFDCEKAWKGCHQSVEDQGGLTRDDGEVNWERRSLPIQG